MTNDTLRLFHFNAFISIWMLSAPNKPISYNLSAELAHLVKVSEDLAVLTVLLLNNLSKLWYCKQMQQILVQYNSRRDLYDKVISAVA